MLIFCRRIIINKPELLKMNGPLLLACNHPNSFLDAAIIADLFKYPVYSLTRGDVFKKPFYRKLLTSLNMFPVYRTSEGAENININYETFTVCRQLFKKNGIVLVFSEGRCINEWHLRPLMKGTARLAFSSWNENIPLEILPVGINYSSFRRFGKNMFINFGEIISKKDFDQNESEGKKYQSFNQKLQEQLQQLVFEIDKNDREKQKKLLAKKPSLFTKIILLIPATIGWLVHAPLYLPINNFTIKRTNNNDHHDSILMALLLFFYPFYLILLIAIAILLTKNFYFLLLTFALPFTAWSYVQVKPQLDK
jgi:1-acyl-sn-glycerol-3-phosphate acyltransferase